MAMYKNKILVVVLAFYLSYPIPAGAQDIFNLNATKEYAAHLYNQQDYMLAAMEYERLVYLKPGDIEFKKFLISSYRKAGEYQHGLNTLSDSDVSGPLLSEHGKLLLLSGDLDKFHALINTKEISATAEFLFLNASSLIYKGLYPEASAKLRQYAQTESDLQRLKNIADEAIGISFKNPALAAGLSAIIPGSGKMYAGYWQDGLISLLMIGLTSWQAYRGFNQQGSSSAYGWIYGGFAGALYLGNIYGSGKAANKYNVIHKSIIDQKLEEVIRYSN